MDDVHVWPCGTWCYTDELEGMLTFMSDDFRTLDADSDECQQFLADELGG